MIKLIKPIKHTLFILGLGLLLPSLAGAFEIERWEIDKTRVYFVRTTELPMVDIRLSFHAGTARSKDLGAANLVSAMMTEGADGMNNQEISRRTALTGAHFGFSNNTDFSFATLRSVTDAKYFDPAIDLFIKILTKPDFPEASLKRLVKQSLVGIEERKQNPGNLAAIAFSQAVYGDHPYAHPKEAEEIRALNGMTPEKLRKFYKRYYVASNMSLVVVGDMTRAEADAVAERLISAMPQGAPAAPVPLAPKPKAQRIHIPFDSEQTHVYIGHAGPPTGDPAYYPLNVANNIFGGSGFGSRLMQEIRVKNGYVYSVSSRFSKERGGGDFKIVFQTKTDQAKDAERIATEMLRELHSEGVSDAELAEAKTSIANSFPLGIGNNGNIAGWTQHIGAQEFPLDWVQQYVPNIQKVDKAAVQEAIEKHIDPDNLVIVTVGR